MVRTSFFVLIALAVMTGFASAQTATPPAGCSAVKWKAESFDSQFFTLEKHYLLVRDVQITCNDVQLFADQVEVFPDADRMRATGNVLFVTEGSRISADRLEFNTRTKTGTFYVASGIA